MSDENTDNKSVDMKDAVKRDDYNKIVESHNSVKLEKEKIETELKELKDEKVAREAKEKEGLESTQKEAWEKEKEDLNKQIEELKTVKKGSKAVENTDPNKGAGENQVEAEEMKKQIDEAIPTEGIRDPSLMTPFERFAYYKNPATSKASSQLVGRALSLATSVGISPYAKKSTDDIIVADIKKSLT